MAMLIRFDLSENMSKMWGEIWSHQHRRVDKQKSSYTWFISKRERNSEDETKNGDQTANNIKAGV